jgi:20S proteasome subunit alpha 3
VCFNAPQAIPLAIKVLAKTMDTSLSPDKVELSTLTRDEAAEKVGYFIDSNLE